VRLSLDDTEERAEVTVHTRVADNARMFALAARYLMLSQKSGSDPVDEAKRERARPEVIAALETLPRVNAAIKAAVDAGNTGGPWGGELAPYTTLADAFVVSLRNVSVWDAALLFMMRVPFRTKVRIASGGISGATVTEGHVKLVSKLTMGTSADVQEKKTIAIIAVTQELLRFANSNAFQLELSSSVAAAVDSAFISDITTGISPIASNGGTSIAVLQDLDAGLAGLSLNSNSKVFCATSPDIMKKLVFKTTSTGARAFPELSISGGNIGGVEFVSTEGVSAQYVFFDASQLAAADNGLELDTSNAANLQLDSSPDSPAGPSTPYVSLWQLNMVAMKATRYWAVERLRSTAVSVISPVSYSGDSPS